MKPTGQRRKISRSLNETEGGVQGGMMRVGEV